MSTATATATKAPKTAKTALETLVEGQIEGKPARIVRLNGNIGLQKQKGKGWTTVREVLAEQVCESTVAELAKYLDQPDAGLFEGKTEVEPQETTVAQVVEAPVTQVETEVQKTEVEPQETQANDAPATEAPATEAPVTQDQKTEVETEVVAPQVIVIEHLIALDLTKKVEDLRAEVAKIDSITACKHYILAEMQGQGRKVLVDALKIRFAEIALGVDLVKVQDARANAGQNPVAAKTASSDYATKLQGIIQGIAPLADGSVAIPVATLQAAGFPNSALKYAAYYGASNPGGKMAIQLKMKLALKTVEKRTDLADGMYLFVTKK